MKKLLFIITLAILFSCEKDSSRSIECYQCRWRNTIPGEHHSTITERCDTEEAIRVYEIQNTWTRGDEANEMDCWKKGEEIPL